MSSIGRRAGTMMVAAALLICGCSSGGSGGSDAGGGNAVAGAGGRGGTGGGGRGGGNAGTMGTAGGGAAGTSGAAGVGGTTGAAGGGGTTGAGGAVGGGAGAGGGGGRGGAGGSGGGAGAAGRGGAGGAGGAPGTGGAAATCTTINGCPATDFCDFPSNQCAGTDTGTCVPRPQDCPVSTVKVCACNGNVYDSECAAHAAGVDITNRGTCAPPTGSFSCGPVFCIHGAQYCEKMVGGAVTNPGSYGCPSLPAGCNGTATCACVTASSQCGNCTTSSGGDVATACLFP